MKSLLKKIALLALCVIPHWALAQPQVNCPQGLRWSSEGYCQTEFDKQKDLKCPTGSHLDQPSITGPKICVTKGSCSNGGKPNFKGVCLKT